MDNSLLNVFVPFIPSEEGSSNRDGTLAESWKPFVNAFNTWMEQAQGVKKVSNGLYCVRMGAIVFLTGTVEKGERIDIAPPVTTFKVGNVLFSEEGFIQNEVASQSLNVTYIAKE